VRAFVAALAAAGRRWVPILDPGIKTDPGYAAYDAGVAEDGLVKSVDGAPYVGQVWAGPALFLDFLVARARRFFAAQIRAFYELAPFSGLWLDMNKPSTFCTGNVCAPRAGGERLSRTPERNSTASDEPLWACRLERAAPAVLNATQRALAATLYAAASAGGPLGARTISSLATPFDGSIYHCDAHNLHGHAEALAAHDAVPRRGRSRSSSRCCTRSTPLPTCQSSSWPPAGCSTTTARRRTPAPAARRPAPFSPSTPRSRAAPRARAAGAARRAPMCSPSSAAAARRLEHATTTLAARRGRRSRRWRCGAGPARVEVVRRRGAGGALEVLRAGPHARAAAAGDRLRVARGAGDAPLRCPEGMRVSCAGEAAGPAAA
jgi:hypothetical protein